MWHGGASGTGNERLPGTGEDEEGTAKSLHSRRDKIEGDPLRGALMSAIILDGTRIAAQIKDEVAEEVKELAAAGLRPGLAVVLAGHNPASEIYVRNKVKSCEQLSIYSEKH